MTISNATINFAMMNQPGNNKQQRTLYNQTTKNLADKVKGLCKNRSDNNRGCRTMTDQARMNDQSTKKLEDQLTRDLTTMQADKQMNEQSNEIINEQMNK